MTIENAILACASSSVTAAIAWEAWAENQQKIIDLGVDNNRRRAMLVGQCAHESARFRTRFENLNYSADGLWRVFRKYFASRAETEHFKHQPEKIANRVYSNRNGNGGPSTGDGWRYRGRGYLQLTGRSNYRVYGDFLQLGLEADPDLAAEPSVCWLVAAAYVARTHRSGRSLLEWADVPDDTMVTKGINGGTNGLDDRMVLTGRAYAALTGQATTAEWQALLLNAGFNPGPIDGLDGPKTQGARAAAGAYYGASGDQLLEILRNIS